MSYTLVSADGQLFQIEASLWQRNCQEQQLLLRYFALPLQEDLEQLWLGIDSANNINACEVFAFLYDKAVVPIVLQSAVLKTALQQLSPTADQVQDYQQALYQHQAESEQPENNDEPIIQLLESIFEQALKMRASDIHLEPNLQGLQVRFRIDGVMVVIRQIAQNFAARLVSRVKLLAHLDIAEKRLPQDGGFRFTTAFNDILDFRLSILPTWRLSVRQCGQTPKSFTWK